VLNWV